MLFFVTVLALAWLAVAYVAKLIKFPLFGIEDGIWTLVVVGIWVIVAFLPMILNYQFLYYSDEGEKLVFRYFNAGLVGGKKNTVEIDKRTFTGYNTESKLFGLNKSIILFQQVGQRIAKYPPIHITALKPDQKAMLLESLAMHAPKV